MAGWICRRPRRRDAGRTGRGRRCGCRRGRWMMLVLRRSPGASREKEQKSQKRASSLHGSSVSPEQEWPAEESVGPEAKQRIRFGEAAGRIGSSAPGTQEGATAPGLRANCSWRRARAPASGFQRRRPKGSATHRRLLRRDGSPGSGWRRAASAADRRRSAREPHKLATTSRRMRNRRRSHRPPQARGARRDSMRPRARGCVSSDPAT
jgi:hypothetical protein